MIIVLGYALSWSPLICRLIGTDSEHARTSHSCLLVPLQRGSGTWHGRRVQEAVRPCSMVHGARRGDRPATAGTAWNDVERYWTGGRMAGRPPSVRAQSRGRAAQTVRSV